MSISRRQLLGACLLAGLSGCRLGKRSASDTPRDVFVGESIFREIVSKAKVENWRILPIGERLGKVALSFLGTPYASRTLETADLAEHCVVNLTEFDCVTFVEVALDLARILSQHYPTPSDLLGQIRLTRYRGGAQNGFCSRLHYTSEWMYDNEKKGVLQNITPALPGAEPYLHKVGFMTAHPGSYRQLRANPDLVRSIRAIEDRVNDLALRYVPLHRITAAERFLQTGDILGLTTTREKIDIGHTGLCLRDASGVPRFLDASSKPHRMKVSLERRLSEELERTQTFTGIMVVRPLEVQ